METVFEKRILKCAASDLSEDELIQSLKESKYFQEGSEIASLDKNDGMYVATVFVPTIASRPLPPNNSNDDAGDFEGPKPKAENGDAESKDKEDSDDSTDGTSDSEPKPEPADSPKKDSKPDSDQEVVSLLHQILQALQGGAPKPPMPPMGAPAPGAGPAGPPAGGPPVPGKDVKEVIHKRGLRPGETPPGVTPIGAPAFSSVKGNIPITSVSHFQAIAPKEGSSVQDAVNDLTQKYGPHGFRVSQIKETPDDQYAALLVKA